MYKCLRLLWCNQDILLRDSVQPKQLNETQLHGEYEHELSKTNKYVKSLNKYTLQCTHYNVHKLNERPAKAMRYASAVFYIIKKRPCRK